MWIINILSSAFQLIYEGALLIQRGFVKHTNPKPKSNQNESNHELKIQTKQIAFEKTSCINIP